MNKTSDNKGHYAAVDISTDLVIDETSIDEFRFVEKDGGINVHYQYIGLIQQIHSNVILFIVQAPWWLVLSLVLSSFLISWFIFAFLYFLISIEHGDFALTNDNETFFENSANLSNRTSVTEQETCVKSVHNFLSALLFSIETQHTIGYGSRYITTECIGGILVLALQSSLGYLLQVIVTQVVFCKLSRPTGKSQYVVFSDQASILPRGDHLTLTFRIGNLSISQLISAAVRLLMIRQRKTSEGEVIPHQIYNMALTRTGNGQLFFPRPTVIEHIINESSPLFGIQRDTLHKEHFEILAIIEGAFDYTGFSCHFRTSYLPNEILWGYEFLSCDSTLEGFNYEKFNQVHLAYAHSRWNYEAGRISEPLLDSSLFDHRKKSHSKIQIALSNSRKPSHARLRPDSQDKRKSKSSTDIQTVY